MNWNLAGNHHLHFILVTAFVKSPHFQTQFLSCSNVLLGCSLGLWHYLNDGAFHELRKPYLQLNSDNIVEANFQGENRIRDRWNFASDLRGKNRTSKTSSLSPFLWPLATHTKSPPHIAWRFIFMLQAQLQIWIYSSYPFTSSSKADNSCFMLHFLDNVSVVRKETKLLFWSILFIPFLNNNRDSTSFRIYKKKKENIAIMRQEMLSPFLIAYR